MASETDVAASGEVTPRAIIQFAFSDGTTLTSDEEVDISEPPFWPPDLFGISAYLLQNSGGYNYVVPGTTNVGNAALEIKVCDRLRDEITEAADVWRESFKSVPDIVREESVSYTHLTLPTILLV